MYICSKKFSLGFVQVLGALVTHVGSGVSFEVSSALQIMVSFATKHARELIPLSSHINGKLALTCELSLHFVIIVFFISSMLISGILDYLEGLTVENLYKVFCAHYISALLKLYKVKVVCANFTSIYLMQVYEVFSHMALLSRSCADSFGSSIANELLIIVRKQVS